MDDDLVLSYSYTRHVLLSPKTLSECFSCAFKSGSQPVFLFLPSECRLADICVYFEEDIMMSYNSLTLMFSADVISFFFFATIFAA